MKHQPTAILFATATTLLLMSAAALGALRSVGADQSSSAIDLVTIDAVPQGNTATSLGDIDFCTRTEVGSTVEVDIVVDAVPEDTPMVGFEFHLLYDPQVVEVTATNNALLLAAGGSYTPFTALSDALPDSDGEFVVSIADLGGSNESGPGVLSRVTLRAKASGVSDLTLGSSLAEGSYPTIIDMYTNLAIQVDQLGIAAVAVGQHCPSTPPQPIVTPLPDLDTLLSDLSGGTPQAQPTQPPDSQQEQTPAPSDADSEASPTPRGTDGPGTAVPTTPGVAPTATPDFRTPSVAATATAVALSLGGTSADSDGDDSDGGFPTAWVIVGVVLGLVAAGGSASYLVYRRRMGRE
jgi:hypothetical protein